MRRIQADNQNRVSAVIFDVDGVLLDIRPLLDAHIFNRAEPDWPTFNAGLHTCTAIEPYVSLCNALWDGGMRIELLTSRAESLREVTEKVLAQCGVKYDRLQMRAKDVPHRGSKLSELAALAEAYEVLAVFEDDPVNVMAIKHMHLPVVPVDSGYHNHPWVDGAESAD